ncbi:hypothetical protein EMPS_00751 [Entomortierella parvispora]|uniref:F-box domain-containing protein n=1 Tax=Entomortierella parvispora TaxID=205924 RepID=A0A9P3H1N3_9FUNG|nr:hypothetical protein EMPS_00751 [Entomortierella parvispora]
MECKKIHALDIPEILSSLGQFLSRGSLVNSFRVSKLWHHVLLPWLWEVTEFGHYSAIVPSLDLIQRYESFIRRLTIGYEAVLKLPSIAPTLPNLASLILYQTVFGNPFDDPKLVLFIKKHRETLKSVILAQHATDAVLEALEECPRLNSLTLGCQGYNGLCPIRWFLQFEKLFSHLDTLSLEDSDIIHSLDAAITTIEDTQQFNRLEQIRDLSLYLHRPGKTIGFFIWIVRQCPDLIRLYWVHLRVSAESPMELLADIFRGDPTFGRKLEDITLNEGKFRNTTFEFLMASLVKLRRLSLSCTDFDTESWTILRMTNSVHLKTLTDLNLLACQNLSGEAIHQMLCEMPSLKVFGSTAVGDKGMMEDPRPWICLDLEELSLRFLLTEYSEDPSVRNLAVKRYLAQVGRLKRLQVFRGFFPRNEKGLIILIEVEDGLDMLKDLRQIRHANWTQRFTGVNELRWILENWLRLDDHLRSRLQVALERLERAVCSRNESNKASDCRTDIMECRKIHPLEIPEILSSVGQFLSGDTLTKCLRVSKLWHSMLLPWVWKSIKISAAFRRHHPRLSLVQKYRSLIQILTIDYRSVLALSKSTVTFPVVSNLRIYETEDEEEEFEDFDDPALVQFIQQHRQTLRSVTFDRRAHDAVLEVFGDCPLLDTLWLWDQGYTLHPAQWGRYLGLWTRLRKLYWNDGEEFEFMESRRLTAMSEWQPFEGPSQIQDLSLHLHDPSHSVFCAWIVRQCPDLVRLGWSHADRGRNYEVMDQLVDIFQSDPTFGKKLEEITYRGEFKNESFRCLMRSLVRLRCLDFTSTSFDRESWMILRTMKPAHLKTLTVLRIEGCKNASSEVVHQMLCEMPSLKVFSAGEVMDKEMVEDLRPWACVDLEELDLRLQLTGLSADPPVRALVIQRYLARVGQLKRLVALRVFVPRDEKGCIVAIPVEGGLDALKDLRRLRSANWIVYPPKSEEELRWCLETWPQLGSFLTKELNLLKKQSCKLEEDKEIRLK